MPFLDRELWGRVTGGFMPARGLDQDARNGTAAVSVLDRFPPSSFPRYSEAVTPRHRESAGAAALRTCGAPGCSGNWNKGWKKRRPVFEEAWGCSSRCLQTLLRSALRRIASDSPATIDLTPHRHRVPLGLVLLAQRWITHPQLQEALEVQRANGRGRIGDLLHATCGLSEDKITRGLALQWSCPVLTLDGFEPGRMALVMPPRLCAESGLIPLRVAGSELLYLASASHMDASISLAVEQMTGLTVESGLVKESEMEAAQARLYAAPSVPSQIGSAQDADDLVAQAAKLLESRQPIASRMVRVRGLYWLRLWLEEGSLSGVGMLPSSADEVEDYLFTIGAGSEVA